MKSLSVTDVARVLRQYHGRYRWLDVFASQVRELVSPTEGVSIRHMSNDQYQVYVAGEILDLQLDQRRNVARWALANAPKSDSGSGTLVGAAVGGLVATDGRRKGPEDLIFGVLVGALVGSALDPDRNRIMTIHYDSTAQRWKVYNGPYVQWAKEALRKS